MTCLLIVGFEVLLLSRRIRRYLMRQIRTETFDEPAASVFREQIVPSRTASHYRSL